MLRRGEYSAIALMESMAAQGVIYNIDDTGLSFEPDPNTVREGHGKSVDALLNRR